MAQGTARRLGQSDRPLESLAADTLGLAKYAHSLADFVQHCDTPFTVAVQGDWGTGKTSLMRMVEDAIRQKPGGERVRTVWFQTWQYSQFGAHENLPSSLLTTLVDELKPPPATADKIRTGLSRLAMPVAATAVRMATMQAVEIGDWLTKNESLVDAATTVRQLKADIQTLIDDLVKPTKTGSPAPFDRVVVFVDDLDRIVPERAVEILETIKLFIDWHGCVFVLALDYAVVSRGLKQKFDIDATSLGGRSFFDKIIQLPFSIPVARFDTPRYIGGLFDDMDLPMRPEDRELFGELIRSSVSVNPRGIKRVFNSLQLLVAIAGAQNDRLVIRILFAVLCLQIAYEPVYNWLLDKGEGVGSIDFDRLIGGDASSNDPDFAEAIEALPEDRRDEFQTFTAPFFRAMSDPEGEDVLDETELTRVRETLKLSRVTSVQSAASNVGPAQDNDRDFRWRNRDMIKRVKAAYEAALAGAGVATGPLRSQGAHSVSSQWLTADLKWCQLGLEHSERRVQLYLQALKGDVRRHGALMDAAVSGLSDSFAPATADEGPLILERALPREMDIAAREEMLMGEVKDLWTRAAVALAKARPA